MQRNIAKIPIDQLKCYWNNFANNNKRTGTEKPKKEMIQIKKKYQGCASGLVIKKQWTCHLSTLEHLDLVPDSISYSSFLLRHARGGSSESSSDWVLATGKGDLVWTPGTDLQPPASELLQAFVERVDQWREVCSLTLCLGREERKKRRKERSFCLWNDKVHTQKLVLVARNNNDKIAYLNPIISMTMNVTD